MMSLSFFITKLYHLSTKVEVSKATYLSKENECYESVIHALKNGYIHLDTAQIYGNEESVGKGIKDSGVNRKDIFVTTKLWVSNFGEKEATTSLEKSLEKLNLEYVDLVLLHAPAIPNPKVEDQEKEKEKNKALRKSAWLALEDFYSKGKTKSIGVSNFWPVHIDEILEFAKVKPHVNQIEYHPWNQRQVQVKYCQEKGIVVEGWGPIAKGQILGDEKLEKIAQKHKKSLPQVCFRWHLQKGIICIPKSIKEERIKENINIFDFELSKEEIKEIDDMHKGYLSAKGWEHDEVL